MQQASSNRFLITILIVTALCASPALTTWAAEKASQPRVSASAPVDINTASLEQLIAIPNIGKATAERIVAFRDENGPFRRIEDLIKIRGIGEKSFEKLRPYVKVSRKR